MEESPRVQTVSDETHINNSESKTTNQAGSDFAEPVDLTNNQNHFSALRFLVITIGGIFMAEIIAMIVLIFFKAWPYYLQTLLDASIMVVLIYPVIYFFSLRPLLNLIEKRQQAEAAISQLSSIVEQSADTVIVTNCAGVIEYVNPAFEQQMGYSKESVLGFTPRVLKSGVHNKQFYQNLWGTILAGDVFHSEITNRSKNGELLHEAKTITPLRDAHGKITHFVATGKNITERKEAEEKLRRAYDELELRVQSRTAELSTANMDLRDEISRRKEAEDELLRLNRTLKALSNSNQAMMHAENEAEYLDQVCKIVVNDCGHVMVWIGYAEDDEDKSVRPVASAGFDDDYLETLKISWADCERGRGPTGTAIRTGKPSKCYNMLTDPQFEPWRAEAIKRGYASSIVLPLIAAEKVIGSLSIYSKEPDPFSQDEERLLCELVSDLAYGITAIRMRQSLASTTEALRESEERFRLALKNVPVIVATQDKDLRFTWAYNQRILRSTDVIGKTDADLFPAEYAARLITLKRQVLESGAGIKEQMWMGNGGKRVYQDIYLEPLHNTAGEIAGVCTATVDLTQQKLVQDALQESEERLSRAQEIAQFGSWELDLISNQLTWSDEIYRIFGAQPYEFRATREAFLEAIHPDDRSAVDSAYSNSIKYNMDSYEIEHRIIKRPNGEVRFVHEKCEHYRDGAGRIIRSVGMVHDITRRKLAEEALKQRNDELEAARTAVENESLRLEAVMEALPVGVAITDIHGGNFKTNQAFEMLWGERPLSESINNNNAYQAWWVETGKTVAPEEWASAQVIEKGVPVLGQLLEIRRADSSHAFIINSASPVCDSDGMVVGAAVAIQDVTDLHLAEQSLRKAHDELERRVLERTVQLAAANRGLLKEIAERKEIEQQLLVRTTAIEAAANGIMITDPQGLIIWANPALARMSGYTLRELIGQSTHIFNSGQHEAKFYHQMWKTILAGTVWQGEMINRRKDGSLYIEEQTITPVFDTYRQLVKFIAIKQDVTTEQKQRRLANALIHSSIALNTSLNLNEVLMGILRQIQKVLACQAAVIMLGEGEMTNIVRQIGLNDLEPEIIDLEKGFSDELFPQLEQVSRSNQPLMSADARMDTDWRQLPGLEWIRSYIVVPIKDKERRIGYITVVSEKPGFFVQENIDDLMAFTHYALTAIQNAQLYAAEQGARQTAEILGAATNAFTQSLNLGNVINTLLNYTAGLVSYDSARVSLRESQGYFRVQAWRGIEGLAGPEMITDQSFDLEANPVLNTVFKTRKSLLISDTSQYPDWVSNPANEHVHNWLGIPIINDDEVVGLFELGQNQQGFFTPDHVQWAEALVRQAAVAIQNAWLFEQVRTGRERHQALARRLVEIQESERRYIARELHDQAGQSLTSLILDLGMLDKEADQPVRVRAHTARLKGLTDEIMEDLHRLAVNLRPVSLDKLGLVAALGQLVKSLTDRTNIQLKFKAVGIGEDERLLPDIEIALYRIAQEALTNVTRHSHASRADLLLEQNDRKVLLIIEDNGSGFDTESSKTSERLGLLGIQERAETLGGTLTIESTPGQGTTLVVEIPNDNTHSFS
jgi:PAS domain S-box-containing protein